MQRRIIEFYKSKKLQIPHMIHKRPYDVLPEQVEEAAEVVYHEIKNGLEIKDIAIARRVFQVARGLEGKKYADENALFENSKKIIVGLTRNRDFWKIKHEKLVMKLDIMERRAETARAKHYRLKVWFVGSYAALIWSYVAYQLYGIFL